MRLEPTTLHGRHVVLEPLDIDHAAALLAITDENRASYVLQPLPRDLPGMRDWVAVGLDEQQRDESLPFVVRRPEGGIIGSTRFMSIEGWSWPADLPPPIPAGPDVVEIRWTWYAVGAQRTAVNTKAKLLLCTHAFERWRVRRRELEDRRPQRAITAAILRLGAQFDGILRAHRAAGDGTVRDSAFFSMLAAVWRAARQPLTERLAGS